MTETSSRDIVIFSTADWHHPFWTNKQHMARLFAGHGYRVLYVESLGLRRPTLQRRDIRRILRRLTAACSGPVQVEPGIWALSPFALPFHSNRAARAANRWMLRACIRQCLRRLNFNRPLVWTYNPMVLDILEGVSRSLLIYHCVDDLTASPGLPSSVLRQVEAELVQQADLVFTTSRNLQETRAPGNPEHTYYLPNVADYEHFSRARQPGPLPADLDKIPRPRIGFVGAISSYKVDLALIAELAILRQDLHWVLIGQVGEGQPDTRTDGLDLPNIHFLGPRPYANLPAYLRGMDILTLPMCLNDYTNSSFPMKFFEYLATGRPVVATPLPALEEFADAFLVGRGPEAFAGAVDRILQGGGPDPGIGIDYAKQYTWERRFAQMESLLHERLEQKEKTR